ncbi:MAG: sulfite exporter TauE/SafE family protein, partial [Candidatus Bipolaricaulota bacterium]|nr:sulfite exporter TauE/SafE family protein [Candidatus Bipolaricaulota bacterium]
SRIVSGVTAKNAVGITSFAEAFTCLVGIASYLILRPGTSWHVAPPLLLGAVLAVPCAALTVRRLAQQSFTSAVAVAAVFLGSWSFFQALR